MTPAEMIAQLRPEIDNGLAFVALAIGFRKNTIFVTQLDSDPLKKLENAIAQGGTPAGLVGVTRSHNKKGSIVARTFIREQWAEDYLTTLVTSIGCQFEVAGAGTMGGHDGQS
jgi:hypothetical protein